MTPLPQHIKVYFFKTLEGSIDLPAFEQWFYACTELESLLPPDDYLELIAYPYRQRAARYGLFTLLNKHIDKGEFETYKLRNLLQDGLLQDERITDILDTYYHLYCHGYRFLSDLGVRYGLMVVENNWFVLSREQQQVLLQPVWPEIETWINRVLYWLDTGLIVLNGVQTSPAQYGYEDYRTADQKIIDYPL